MKNVFKKNQVIITALAIMIAVAGYLNFAQDEAAVTNTSQAADEQKDTKEVSADDGILYDLSEDDLADAKEDTDLAITDTGEVVASGEDETQVGDAVMVSNTIDGDFFASARLTREQTRAKNKEMLMEIVDNEQISEEQKKEAINEVVSLTKTAEMESATEMLLEAKGFTDAVVSIIDDSADVIVNANELTEQQIAQIEDIVKRKTEIAAENIVISPVGVADAEETK